MKSRKSHFHPFRHLVLLSLFLFMLGGCAGSSGGMTVSNIPLENRKFEVLGPAEITVAWTTFDTGIIGLAMREPPVDQAMNSLLQEKGGDALINVRYWTDRSVIFFITYNRFHLKADVVKLLD